MSNGHDERFARRNRSLLEDAAKVHGLDYDTQVLAPGSTPREKAFQLMTCGAILVLGLADKDTFPALDSRKRAKGARLTGRRLGDPGAQQALAFMTQVIPTFFSHVWPGPEFQFEMRELVQSHYPISESDQNALVACEAEFRVMETHELREDFELATGTGYHLELLDGQDPDSDPELVEIQETYAWNYFVLTAQRHALALLLGDKFSKVEPDLDWPGSMEVHSIEMQGLRLLMMRHVAPHWRNFTSPQPLPLGEYDPGYS